MQFVLHDTSLVGIAMFIALSLVFWLFGKNITVFSATFAGLLICFFLIGHLEGVNQFTADAFLTIAGFALYFFGLLIVRTIIQRSISLHLLISSDAWDRLESMKSEIDHRLSDLTRYKLATNKDEHLILTPFGKFAAGVTTVLYQLLGQEK